MKKETIYKKGVEKLDKCIAILNDELDASRSLSWVLQGTKGAFYFYYTFPCFMSNPNTSVPELDQKNTIRISSKKYLKDIVTMPEEDILHMMQTIVHMFTALLENEIEILSKSI